GSATDASDSDGHAALLAELIFRGAGGLSSREHSDAFDRLGVQRSSDIGTHHLHLRLTMLGSKLSQSIPLAAAMLRQPAMPEGELDPVRSLCIQSLQSLDDDPQHLVMLRLRDKHHPPPFNRHGHGDMHVLERASI